MADIQLSALINKFLQETSTTASEKNTLRGYLNASTDPSWPKVAYVETTGNNATAVIGDPSLPFLTPQGAYNAISAAAAGQYVMRCGVGNFGTITLDANWAKLVGIYGVFGSSNLTGITGAGAAPAAAPDDNNGVTGDSARSLSIISDHSINLGSITVTGGAGGEGGPAINQDTNGGFGASGGALTLRNVTAGTIDASGGNGGGGNSYSSADAGGTGGLAGYLNLSNVICSSLTSLPGQGGTGSTPGTGGTGQAHVITGLICAGLVSVQGVIGSSVVQGIAGSKNITDAGDGVVIVV